MYFAILRDFVLCLQESAGKLVKDVNTLYGIWCAFIYVSGDMYARLSVNIYVTLQDFTKLRDAILDLQKSTYTCDPKDDISAYTIQ